MQATLHFSLICQSRENIIVQNAGQVGFAAGKVDFQVTCFAGREALERLRPDRIDFNETKNTHIQ